MFKFLKNKTSKFLAGFLALIMFVTIIPGGINVAAFAATIDNYTVSLTDGENVIALSDVQVTLTDKEDEANKATQKTVDGIATFSEFVEDGKTYVVSVASITGFEQVEDIEITASAQEKNFNLTLKAIEKVTVSGIVNNENGEPYEGAIVSLDGYSKAETTTGKDGRYTLEAYKGQNYTFKVTAKESDAKYEVISEDVVFDQSVSDKESKFEIKKLTVKVTGQEDAEVSYGESYTVNVGDESSNQRISKLTVNGKEETLSENQKTWSKTFENITEDINVQVEYVEMVTFKVTVNDGGKVTLNGNKEAIGGKVETFLFDKDSEVKVVATANEKYIIESVIIDEQKEVIEDKAAKWEKSLTANKDYEISVAFKKNIHTVTFRNESDKGTVKITLPDDKTVEIKGKGTEKSFDIEEGKEFNVAFIPEKDYVPFNFFKQEEGNPVQEDLEIVSYTENRFSVQNDTTFSVNFDGIDTSTLKSVPPTAAVKVSTDNGKTFIKAYEKDGEYIYYVPKNAQVKLSPVENIEVDGVKIVEGIKNNFLDYCKNDDSEYHTIKESITSNPDVETSEEIVIRGMQVRTGTNRGAKTYLIGNPIKIVFDNESPEIKDETGNILPDESNWINKDTTFALTVSDKTSSVVKHVYLQSYNQKGDEWTELTHNEEGVYYFEHKKVDGVQNEYPYKIKAVDAAGNETIKDFVVKNDTLAPNVEKAEFKKTNDSAFAKILNFLTFGNFFNSEWQVEITANDNGTETDMSGSGVKSYSVYFYDADGSVVLSVENQESNIFTFNNEKLQNFKGTVKVKVTDTVGNITDEIQLTEDNSNLGKDTSFMIENDAPVISALSPENESIHKDAFDIEFKVSDIVDGKEYSGLSSINVTVNGVDVLDNQFSDEKTDEKVFTLAVNPVDKTVNGVSLKDNWNKGKLDATITACDNAGNVSETTSVTYYFDRTNPTITNFAFNAEGKSVSETVDVLNFGYYFKDDVKVTVTAQDAIGEDETIASGVDTITIYLKDIDANKLYKVDGDTISPINDIKEASAVKVDENSQVTFTIPANFKGQVFAYATDKVGNSDESFVYPDASIVENQDKHEEEKHIAFKKASSNFTAKDGTELFANDVPVELTVTDTYSGIKNIEWEVVAPYDTENNQVGKAIVNNDKTLTEDSDKDWTITQTENNLVTEMKKEIVINNNSNNIVLRVKMTDRAGNVSEEEIQLSIDKTSPVIEVVYDNNKPDDVFNDIYKADRTATITVTERNFNEKDIIYKITNTDGVIPVLSEWTETVNEENPDETTYTAKVEYNADGDYTFDISYADLANNQAAAVAQHKFTIDKTLPTVAVSYDNNSVLNGNYYKADRIATITINEHNFDASRVKVVGIATDNGAPVTFPALSSWTNNGDTHTATIHYSADAKYSFDIEFLDKAGNSIADYAAEEFFVDKTAPVIEIGGVADKSANNDKVAPVITYTDTNFNKDGVKLSLTGANNGNVDYNGAFEDIVNGQKFVYADFERVEKVDDIYTLTATLTDFAGNITTKTIAFSANRFGSVYTFDDSLQTVIGKYNQNERDIVFTETNVDSLARESIMIKLFKNGTPSNLVQGKDYTITASGGNGQWSQYKYVINKALFANDGNYRLTIYSVDAAGNVNENIDESKKAEISFGIDKTKPIIVPIDFENDKQYNVEVKNAKIEIKDNFKLESVKIYLNGKEVECKVDGENYTFDIPQANDKQNVEIVAVDAAGNEYRLKVENFLVSTNVFVRWYNNTPLFIGSIIGVVVIAVGVTAFALFGKKKKENEGK